MTTAPGPRRGLAPAPPPAERHRRPPPPAPPPRDARPVTVLRVTAYVLTSVASLVFLALVVYGYLSVQDLKQRLAQNPLFGGGSYSAPAVPGADNFAGLCAQNPTAPECNGTGG